MLVDTVFSRKGELGILHHVDLFILQIRRPSIVKKASVYVLIDESTQQYIQAKHEI